MRRDKKEREEKREVKGSGRWRKGRQKMRER